MFRNEHGQALVEFAMVAGVFLLCLLAAISAAIYTVQRSVAVTAVAAGARVAAGGSPGPDGAGRPDLAGATPVVARLARPVLGGTHISEEPPGRPCPGALPRGEVAICATAAGDMVTVRLRGRPATAVPIPGLDWSLDLAAETHTVTFKP